MIWCKIIWDDLRWYDHRLSVASGLFGLSVGAEQKVWCSLALGCSHPGLGYSSNNHGAFKCNFWFILIHPEGNRTWDGLKRVQNKQSVVEHYTEALLELLLGTTRNHIGITILTALQANKRRTTLSTCGFLGVHTWIKSMAGMKSNTLQFAVCVINGRRKPLRMVIGL